MESWLVENGENELQEGFDGSSSSLDDGFGRRQSVSSHPFEELAGFGVQIVLLPCRASTGWTGASEAEVLEEVLLTF